MKKFSYIATSAFLAVALCLPALAAGQAQAATSKSTAKAIATCKKNIKKINARAAKIAALSTSERTRYKKVDVSLDGYLAKAGAVLETTKPITEPTPELAEHITYLENKKATLQASIDAYRAAKKPYLAELDKQKTKTKANCSTAKGRGTVATKFTKFKAYPAQLRPVRDAPFKLYKTKVGPAARASREERKLVTKIVKTLLDSNSSTGIGGNTDPEDPTNARFSNPPATEDDGSGGDENGGGDGGGSD